MTVKLVHSDTQKTKTKRLAKCPMCESNSYVVINTGKLKQKCCVFCLMTRQRIVEMQ